MVGVAVLARLVLAGVFAVTGIAKAFTVGATAAAVPQFGLPRSWAVPAAITLPVVELALVVGLLGSATASPSAWAAAGLLAVFVALTATTVARGRTVACNCFGSLSTAVVQGRTVARNAVLLAVALLAAVSTGPSPVGVGYRQLDGLQWTVLGLVVAVSGLAVALWRTSVLLLAQHGRLLLQLDQLSGTLATQTKGPAPTGHGLEVGTPAPSFTLDSLAGTPVSLADLTRASRPVLLVFGAPGCGPCLELLPSLAEWQRDDSAGFTAVLVATGSAADNQGKAAQYGLGMLLLDPGGAVTGSFRVPGTPSAVLVGVDGRVAAPLAVGGPNVQTLAHSMADRALSTPPTLVGTPAPAFRLPDGEGGQVTEAFFATHQSTVVLFWNSGCGFCQRMRARLQAWDLATHGAAPALLVLSTDPPGAPNSLRLNAPVLSDDGSVMRAFGATGTPIAVLVNSSGVIASELAPGEQAVFDLLGPASTSGRRQLPVLPGGRS